MTKSLIFNFDGTNNEPQDAVQEIKRSGELEDDNITNILKFHLLIGGTLKKENQPLADGSRIIYYNGVGTIGNFFERALNTGLALEGDDVATIIKRALNDFEQYYEQIDEPDKPEVILVTGFSRGGAIARRFAALIDEKVTKPIIIEGIFDTVASIGLPNLSSSDRPTTDVVFEHGCTLPGNVKEALHLVSLDDKRRAFQPTLMNKDRERVKEVWFAGAHSDVGGGYYRDGLSDTALRFFLDWFEDLKWGIPLLTSKTIDYNNLVDKTAKYRISQDDVQIDANAFGVSHQQERSIFAAWTLTDRRCCVIDGDRVKQGERPLVHWSVAERISGDQNYKPKSLDNVEHTLLYADEQRKDFSGTSEHKHMYKRRFRVPERGAEGAQETLVFAYQKYNHTNIYLEKGKTYKIEVSNDYQWRDGGVAELDGNGWNRDHVAFGQREIGIAAMEPFRRVKDADWFTLCGCYGEDDSTAFTIGNGLGGFVAEHTGELCAFANDLNGFYGNNTGKLKMYVRLLD
jgi:pimeloyl-ACP methyl ester carboxylesterase